MGWGGPVNASKIVGRGLTLHGAWHWNHLRDVDNMIATIRGSREMLDKIITHHFPMSKVRDAWELQLIGKNGKVILHPWE